MGEIISNFSGKIMNLRSEPIKHGISINVSEIQYKAFLLGHKQARHQAAEIALEADRRTDWHCKAHANNNHPGEQADCDWPDCGCDPYANKVIEAIEDSGFEIVPINRKER